MFSGPLIVCCLRARLELTAVTAFVFFAAVAWARGVASDLARAAHFIRYYTLGLTCGAGAGVGMVIKPGRSVHFSVIALITALEVTV